MLTSSLSDNMFFHFFFFFQAEDGILDADVTGVQTCALPILIDGRGWLACGSRRPQSWCRAWRRASTSRVRLFRRRLAVRAARCCLAPSRAARGARMCPRSDPRLLCRHAGHRGGRHGAAHEPLETQQAPEDRATRECQQRNCELLRFHHGAPGHTYGRENAKGLRRVPDGREEAVAPA